MEMFSTKSLFFILTLIQVSPKPFIGRQGLHCVCTHTPTHTHVHTYIHICPLSHQKDYDIVIDEADLDSFI